MMVKAPIKINNAFGNKFDMKVSVYEESALSPLLEALLRECRAVLSWNMLNADKLVVMAEMLKELSIRYKSWNVWKANVCK